MTREDLRLLARCSAVLGASLGCLWLVGQLMLWTHPLSEVDKKCMSKTALEVGECIRDGAKR